MRIDRRRGNNIIGSPYEGNNSYLGRRSSGISNDNNYSRGSVKRDAFPRTTPSVVKPTEGSYRKGLFRGNNVPETRSGNYPSPSFNRGANQANPGAEPSRRNSGVLDAGKRNNFLQRENGNSPAFRNYRNYKATEPRQVNPAPARREAPQAVNRGGVRTEGNRGFRNSREK
jgi:hypothetical protein